MRPHEAILNSLFKEIVIHSMRINLAQKDPKKEVRKNADLQQKPTIPER
ncbi:MAG: hypothetical protein OXB95_05335 [Rhodobacteraceae bacterium]|nr:hypothetical protein [Paracoccaceae bacterium]